MRGPLTVAAIIDAQTVSGPGKQLATLAGALRPRGVEIRVLLFQRSGRPTPALVDYLNHFGVRCEVVAESGPADVRIFKRVSAVFSSWTPDIVQTHGYKPATLAYFLRRLGAQWPWIGFFHGDTAENLKVNAYNRLHHLLLRTADRIVVMSERQQLQWGRMDGRVRVIHNAILPVAHQSGTPVALPIGSKRSVRRPLIGVVSRLSPEKGVDTFLEACMRLRTLGYHFSAVICGDGPERSRLESLTDSFSLASHVQFLGHLASADALYRELDLVVIPSRSEGLPNVLLEALRADVPIVATSVGGIPEVLIDSAAGIMVPPDSPSELANAMAVALHPQYRATTQDARKLAGERFSLAKRVDAHLHLYTDLLSSIGPIHRRFGGGL